MYRLTPEQTTLVANARSIAGHCVFTVGRDFDPDTEARWLKVLYSMSYGNPLHRQMMDMEGLKKWEPGRTSGFAALTEAADKLHYFA